MTEEKTVPSTPRKKTAASKKKRSVKKRTLKKGAVATGTNQPTAKTEPGKPIASKKRGAVKKSATKKKRATKKRRTATPANKPVVANRVTAEQRYRMIAEAAYYLAEKRDFAPGYEMEDWITAEKMVEAHIETLSR